MPLFDDPSAKDQASEALQQEDQRAPYEAPRLRKKRSVALVTLTSGSSGGSGFSSSGTTGVTCVTCH